MKSTNIRFLAVINLAVMALCTVGQAQQASEPPPLPFHAVEGVGGVFATHMAYLVNPDTAGGLGLPSVGGIYVNMGNGRQLYSATATETLWDRLELGYAYMAFDMGDLPDAIAKGNDSPFGLAAGVWTRDIRKAHQAAAALDAGTVWVNCYNAFDNASPWGGFKQSGWGREKGPYGLDLFTQIKSVIINFT